MSQQTKQAISHTLHCLTGCSIGEVLGMVLGQNLSNLLQTALAIALAFVFGYGLTFWGATKSGKSPKEASKIALAIDTVSITSMEIIDNTVEWIIPGAINARLSSGLFWWSLAVSLAVAFVLTVPVNRLLISRGQNHPHHHH